MTNEHADCGVTYREETPENRRRSEARGGKAVYSQDLFNRKIEAFIFGEDGATSPHGRFYLRAGRPRRLLTCPPQPFAKAGEARGEPSVSPLPLDN